jgi:hypothetical protein
MHGFAARKLDAESNAVCLNRVNPEDAHPVLSLEGAGATDSKKRLIAGQSNLTSLAFC